MKRQRFLSLPVFAVFVAMGFVYYTTIFIFIEDRLGLKSSAGFLNTLVFSGLALMSLVSFVSCVLMDPGHVPSNFVPEIENGEDPDQGTRKNGAISSRFCDKCSTHKPPRAHHCRVCRKCVLRMDHHCVWINNCVGFGNYKPFFILILYAATASIYSAVMIVASALQKDWEFFEVIHVKILYVTCGSIMGVLSLTLGTLLFWHTYLLSQNMTTIEYHEGIRAQWLARKSGQNYRHPFHLGVYRNIISVLGPNMLKWFCPTAVGHLHDGISFPNSRNS